ncbi:hypothetical protein IU429_03025 [Nocardia elegans]|uniref:Uncharacterized protein n=1 Tax=Nocardia elegans TaxID=300029 RepID=A0ABW6TN64_9NOCA|nr:hypothetical protein [Nocardia elegans]MBF6446629.1 hypothetical protein [Nocardia elegans]
MVEIGEGLVKSVGADPVNVEVEALEEGVVEMAPHRVGAGAIELGRLGQ